MCPLQLQKLRLHLLSMRFGSVSVVFVGISGHVRSTLVRSDCNPPPTNLAQRSETSIILLAAAKLRLVHLEKRNSSLHSFATPLLPTHRFGDVMIKTASSVHTELIWRPHEVWRSIATNSAESWDLCARCASASADPSLWLYTAEVLSFPVTFGSKEISQQMALQYQSGTHQVTHSFTNVGRSSLHHLENAFCVYLCNLCPIFKLIWNICVWQRGQTLVHTTVFQTNSWNRSNY